MPKRSRSAFSAALQRCGQYAVYLMVRTVEGILSVLPMGLLWRVGQIIGLLCYCVFGKYRKLAQQNLRIALGRELSAAQRGKLARQHFASLGANIICGFKMPTMTEAQVAALVTMEGAEHAQAVAAQGKPLLFAVMHLSCWELLTQVPSLFLCGRRGGSIYQTLANPYLDAHVRRRREARGYRLFARSDGFSGPMKFLREEQGGLGVLVDQHAGDQGVWCPFFDRLASTTSLPALMAIRCSAPLLPIAVYDGAQAGTWRIVISPPVQNTQPKPSAEGLTAELNLAVEAIIRRAPQNWFWVHNRWKTPKPDFLLASYHRGITLPQGYDRSRLQPFELIVRSPNWLGDACMAFPAVRALKAGRPDLRLTVFAPAKLSQLWTALGIVDEVIGKEGKEGLLAARRRIQATGRHYDAGILFTNSTRSTLEFWLAGVARLAGYKGSLRSWLVQQMAPELKPSQDVEHHARRYMRLAAFCGAKTDDPALWITGNPQSKDGVVRLGICAGAEYGPAKRWPMERFAAVANNIGTMAPGVQWQLFGAPGEAEQGVQLSSQITVPHENLVGKTGLAELIQRLLQCRLLLTNDTGTMHLAAALGVPTVSIFGSTEPVLTGPLGDRHTVLRQHVSCSPCFMRVCPFGHYDCMDRITVQSATDAVFAELKRVRA
jgi:heptosyltransferase II